MIHFRGKIRFYTLPPEDSVDTHISSKIISEHTNEFNELSGLDHMKDELLDSIEDSGQNKYITYLPISDDKDVGQSKLNEVCSHFG